MKILSHERLETNPGNNYQQLVSQLEKSDQSRNNIFYNAQIKSFIHYKILYAKVETKVLKLPTWSTKNIIGHVILKLRIRVRIHKTSYTNS